MNELRRMQYLDALGIDMFVPRLVLPGSAKVQQCELPPAVASAHREPCDDEPFLQPRPLPLAASGVHNLVEEAAKDVNSEVLQVLRAVDGHAVDEKAPTQKLSQGLVEIASQSQVQVKDVAQFSLSVWPVRGSVLVIDTREPRSALPTAQLLSNILTASGLLKINLPQAQILNWPLADPLTVDQGWQAASDMVHAYVEASNQSTAVRHILLMGEDALKAVVGKQKLANYAFGDQLTVEQFELAAVYLPSLVEILRQPEHKELVWRSLMKLAMRNGNA